MKKILIASALLMFAHSAFAAAIFTITPSITQTTLRSDGLTEVIFNVVNSTPKTINNITVDPAFNTTGNRSAISVANNTCSSLASGANCHFQVLLGGTGQPSSFQISPRVCGFNGAFCSQPIAANRLNVHVNIITGRVFAYVGLGFGDNRLQAISANNFILGNPLPGFDFNNAQGAVVSHNGKKVYVANDNGSTINVVNAGLNPSLLGTVNVDNNPTGIDITPDDSKVYVANSGSGTVSVINALTNTIITSITVQNTPEGVAITPDGLKVYVSNNGSDSVSVIDTNTNQVIRTINLAAGSQPFGVAVSPDGGHVYVANSNGSVSVIDSSTDTEVTTITGLSTSFKGIAVIPDGSSVWVASANTGTVTVIDTQTNTERTEITTSGAASFGVSFSPMGDIAFVTNLNQFVSTINTSTLAVINVVVPNGQATFGNFVG